MIINYQQVVISRITIVTNSDESQINMDKLYIHIYITMTISYIRENEMHMVMSW